MSADQRWTFSLDDRPPIDPSVAAAYWCEMDYFLAHTSSGDHLPCKCPEGVGHNDPTRPAPDEQRRRYDAEGRPLCFTCGRTQSEHPGGIECGPASDEDRDQGGSPA